MWGEVRKVFPNDMAVFKIFYLAIENITKKWTLPIQNWNTAIGKCLVICVTYKNNYV
ncbi:hypothetical protein [Spiroplasma ixodetis]|uniref:Transposase n=1 Tax=Spiroplasma ixodetis TaxID=2141 RepID=A0ABM8BT84_9MOLU|nr:hypothetical protein SHM_06840 [Spiroplasma ixodetis]